MKRIKFTALFLAALMVLALAACGTKEESSAAGTEQGGIEEAVTEYRELMDQENEILSENTELWDKVFLAMNKDLAVQEESNNYGDLLLKTIENARDQFTVEELTPRMVEVVGKVVSGLQLKCPQICFQSHIESFYYYMIHQQAELWKREVFVFEYNDTLKTMRFQCNRHTTPRVVFIEHLDYPEMKRVDWAEDEAQRMAQQQELDAQFGQLCESCLHETDVSTVFLIGEGFKEGWTRESLKILCHNRRVFQGNNLYSKGACYAGMEKLNPQESTREYVYLGEDKLKSNIGMRALRRGEDSYLAILDAGVNWYEAKTDFDLILESGNVLCFTITPLTGENIMDKTVTLDGLPERPRCTTRLRIHAEMTAIHTLTLEITDMGFGELFKSSGRAWTHTLQV